MDTRPLRILLAANAAVFVLVCAAFVLRHICTGLYPEAVESWLDDHEWLMWTAVGIVVSSPMSDSVGNLEDGS
ncbi:hypothetical protein [Streptomyces sp. GbtcB6]|uniref:hypothetical protein n=1 Tax=Streptomyces sp. GbtcB6 TaxID=2824751 RepID=UPI001C30C5D1|nr:hypothetical protein [Streptomyces sp. GbtcB6]